MQEDNELRLVPGDELRLRYPGDGTHSGWQSVGHVVCYAVGICGVGFLGFCIALQVVCAMHSLISMLLNSITDDAFHADKTHGARGGGS